MGRGVNNEILPETKGNPEGGAEGILEGSGKISLYTLIRITLSRREYCNSYYILLLGDRSVVLVLAPRGRGEGGGAAGSPAGVSAPMQALGGKMTDGPVNQSLTLQQCSESWVHLSLTNKNSPSKVQLSVSSLSGPFSVL